MGIVLKILLNTNGVKTSKVRDLGAVKKILTYVAPVSLNPDFHMIFHSQNPTHRRVYTVCLLHTLGR